MLDLRRSSYLPIFSAPVPSPCDVGGHYDHTEVYDLLAHPLLLMEVYDLRTGPDQSNLPGPGPGGQEGPNIWGLSE